MFMSAPPLPLPMPLPLPPRGSKHSSALICPLSRAPDISSRREREHATDCATQALHLTLRKQMKRSWGVSVCGAATVGRVGGDIILLRLVAGIVSVAYPAA
jgi:hypothetical protein